MTQLWDNPKHHAWREALDAYPAVIHVQNTNELDALDLWYRETLPALLAARGEDPYITLQELIQATRWKMKRGVWRQRNLVLVSGNSEQAVEETSRRAFAAVPDPRKPIALVATLAGVGPATASAVLSAHTPAVYPFFDELVAEQIPGLGDVAFTPAYYARYAQQLRERAQALNEAGGEDTTWTANDLAQALWSASGGKVQQAKSRP
jgi:hypothetical protein